MQRFAPAKINLFLRVLRKRADGYHDIFSLIQKISLYDELTFLPRPKGIELKCPNVNLPTNEDNLVFHAAQSIFAYCNYPSGIEITLNKKIPIAAGLGGGSSDAATTLMALNDLCSFGLKKNELMKLGAKLGADVPFFIFGNTAFARGTGNKLKACKNFPKLYFVLINPQFPLSTKTVYENLNLRLTRQKINYSIPRFFALGDVTRELHNDLEDFSLKLHPELGNLKQMLLHHGALGALMTGSGPTVFGIFSDEKSAKKAQIAIDKELSGKCAVFFARSI
ncbi:MAG: 4-(cytidine 5'-diphospho)-2-C-methyl-D-erythritol kinase [Deltaproteobacteria bacterium RBG_16_44_11]|nr:MAG: 4-(cytidine 5'-diphospho)-2-C-methyl-D-erythritol kinase [Deltaproteobacteria bacterium RBG_16_44_11]